MAGDWIKMTKDLPDKPEVWSMAGFLGIDADCVVGKLLRVWAWFDSHTQDGNAVSVTYSLLDRIAGVSGFAEAMALCGWLEQSGSVLRIPNFGRHNGETAKKRALTNERVAKSRELQRKSNAECNAASVTDSVAKSVTREEKRREEKNIQEQEQKQEHLAPSAVRSEPALDPATGRPLTIPINTGAEHPVTEDDLGEYRRLFPAVDLHRELLLARRWCLDNPTKRKTARGVRAFLTRWLEKAQDRAPGRLLQPVHGGSREASRPLSAVDRVNEAVARRRAERGEHFPADFGFDNGRIVAEQ